MKYLIALSLGLSLCALGVRADDEPGPSSCVPDSSSGDLLLPNDQVDAGFYAGLRASGNPASDKICDRAKNMCGLGWGYGYGHDGSDGKIDCSHFVCAAMGWPYCSTEETCKEHKLIKVSCSRKTLSPGDIIIWNGHEAIYAGNGNCYGSNTHGGPQVFDCLGGSWGAKSHKCYKQACLKAKAAN